MRRVYSSPNLTMVYLMKTILETRGIECIVQGEYRRMGGGEIPPIEAWVELWVLDDERLVEAQQILEESREKAETEQGAWRCPKCGEELEGQFGQCWKCGTERS